MARPLTSADAMNDASIQAFRRLLLSANDDAQARVDAVVALSQRTLLVATFTSPMTPQAYRTLRREDQSEAIAVFTDRLYLEKTATRLQWHDASSVEVGAPYLFRWMKNHHIDCLWVDPGEPHSTAFVLEEMEPLIPQPGRHEPAGPFASAGALPEQVKAQVRAKRLVRRTLELKDSFENEMADGRLQSGARVSSMPPPPSESGHKPPVRKKHSLEELVEQSTGSELIPLMEPMQNPPHPAVLEAWWQVLEQYPEVEWACYASLITHEANAQTYHPVVLGLRIDKNYRVRVNEIAKACMQAVVHVYPKLTVVFIDSMGALEQAKNYATVFYPWKT